MSQIAQTYGGESFLRRIHSNDKPNEKPDYR
jgi:hypothetical protein